MSRLGKKIAIRAGVFTFSLKLEKWSFHVADFSRTGKKCTEIIKTPTQYTDKYFVDETHIV